MPKATISVPASSDLPTVLRFGRELDFYTEHDHLTFDFGRTGFFSPYSMLFLAAKLKSFRAKRPNIRLEFTHYKDQPYLAHFGFFKMFGVDYGRDVGEAWGGGNYLPITELTRANLYEDKNDNYREIADLIQRHADRIALVISRDRVRNADMYDVLSYSVREVMRNVFEHARINSLFYAAQYWPKSNKVEFAIADLGIGIRSGLAENPNFRF